MYNLLRYKKTQWIYICKKPMWTSEVFGNDAFMTIWPHNGKCSLKIRYQSIFSKIFKRSHFVQNFSAVAEILSKFNSYQILLGYGRFFKNAIADLLKNFPRKIWPFCTEFCNGCEMLSTFYPDHFPLGYVRFFKNAIVRHINQNLQSLLTFKTKENFPRYLYCT